MHHQIGGYALLRNESIHSSSSSQAARPGLKDTFLFCEIIFNFIRY